MSALHSSTSHGEAEPVKTEDGLGIRSRIDSWNGYSGQQIFSRPEVETAVDEEYGQPGLSQKVNELVLDSKVDVLRLSIRGIKGRLAQIKNRTSEVSQNLQYLPSLTLMKLGELTARNHVSLEPGAGQEIIEPILTADKDKKSEKAARTLRMKKIAQKAGKLSVAAVVTTALAYGAYKGAHYGVDHYLNNSHDLAQHSTSHENAHAILTHSQPKPAAPETAHVINNSTPKTGHHVVKAIAKAKAYQEHLKYYGDNIWNHAKLRVEAAHPHISQERLNQLTTQYSNLIVKVNHIKDATQMHIGQVFKMPRLH